MTTHSPNHLKPGQIVQHPEKGHGIVGPSFSKQQGIEFVDKDGVFVRTCDLTSWEPVETLPAGHVAIRTDDLDFNHPEGVRALWLRVQRLATDPNSRDTYEEWAAANNSRCNEVLRPGHVQVRVDDLHEKGDAHHLLESRAWAAWQDWAEQQTESHTEPATTPVEPVRLMHPEPTQRGAKASIYHESGTVDRLLRAYSESTRPWADDLGRRYSWDEADAAGTLIPGWDDDDEVPAEPAKLSHPEPMEFGAKASYIDWKTGRRLCLIRTGNDDTYLWINENGIPWTWDELVEHDGECISLLIGCGDGQ